MSFISSRVRRAFAFTFLLSVAACASPDTDTTGIAINGRVKGTIIDNTGAAVANAAVALTATGQAARTTSSGADGNYMFADVPPGTYTLTVTPPTGYAIGAAGTASVAVAKGAEASATAIVLNKVSLDSPFFTFLRTRLEAATAADEFSGAVLIMRNGVTVFEGAYGLADREKKIANTMLTQFRVGSMNKMITAVAVMQLAQAGKLSLSTPLQHYLPDYPNTDLASKVTLHHLLTHTGGTGDIFGSQFMANRLQLRNVDDYLKLYGGRGLQFTPGTQWAYSNYGFILLGAVIERVTGMSYDNYVAANILTPAGMTSTGAFPEDSLMPLRSVGYMMASGTLVSNAATLPSRGTPAGGGYSTVGDFARFAAALQDNKLLDATHKALLLSGKVTMNPSSKYAYGFADNMVLNRRFVGHSGGAAGMNGDLMFEPNGGYIVVVLSNLDPPAATQQSGFILGGLPQ